MTRIAVEVECADWRMSLPDVKDIARRAARVASLAPAGGTMTILLTDDAVVRDLNARFRGKDAATNVLAFPAVPGEHLGDIALAYGLCALEATEQGKSLADHLRHLVVHGVLHLGGYDHQEDGEATIMEALERRLLAQLGVADPYAARVLETTHG